ncbi:MAG: sugar nucleotide-binding protein [Bryobacterales bacterium]|nr:sugar nucleotide-binding protein [Bryobacterales bacterium]
MRKIGIIGANGQVGTEVSLFLRQTPGVEPVPISRTRAGAAFLRRHGFDCRIGSAGERAKDLLQGCDVVADFTLPTGSAHEVREQMRGLIPAAVTGTPAGAPYVYLSSITAFGFRDFFSPLRHYRFSRNSYGSSKRYAEKLVGKACEQTRRERYVLRVGVVHGELQAVTREMVARLKANPDRVASVPDCESYTVFAYSIAEALAAIANGGVRPDVYTLVSNPGWRWSDVHEHLAERAGVEAKYRLIGPERAPSRTKQCVAAAVAPAKSLLWKQKDLVQGYLSASLPGFEHQLRAVYHRRNAAAEICEGELAAEYRPYGNNHTVLPGPRLAALSDSRKTMAEPARRLRESLRGAPAESRGATARGSR